MATVTVSTHITWSSQNLISAGHSSHPTAGIHKTATKQSTALLAAVTLAGIYKTATKQSTALMVMTLIKEGYSPPFQSWGG